MDNKGPFGIYDESFDLDRDGELNATEFDYMMEEYKKAGLSSDSEDDDWVDDEEEEDYLDDSEDDDWEDNDDY